MSTAITASEARRRLFPLIQEVNDDHSAVEIVAKGGNAVLMSKEDYDAWQTTAYLLRSPANARRILEALAQMTGGELERHDLVEP